MIFDIKKGEEQGSKSPFSQLSEPISLSSLLFEPISPSSLNVYLTFSPSSLFYPYFSLLLTIFGPFLPPPYSVPHPFINTTRDISNLFYIISRAVRRGKFGAKITS